MKALRHLVNGLNIEHNPISNPGPKNVLIKVRATVITRGELKWPETDGRKDLMLGYDISGRIESVGTEVTKFKTADEVFGLISFLREGGPAEYTLGAEHEVAFKPRDLSFEEAAAMSLLAMTVWQTFFDNLDAKRGQKVLITVAGGGVGVMLVQIGHSSRLRISATCSTAKSDLVRSLGTSEIFD